MKTGMMNERTWRRPSRLLGGRSCAPLQWARESRGSSPETRLLANLWQLKFTGEPLSLWQQKFTGEPPIRNSPSKKTVSRAPQFNI